MCPCSVVVSVNPNNNHHMKSKFNIGIALITVALYSAIVYLVYRTGEMSMLIKFQKELVERNLAEYNKKTGEWQYCSDNRMSIDEIALMPSIIPASFPTKIKTKTK